MLDSDIERTNIAWQSLINQEVEERENNLADDGSAIENPVVEEDLRSPHPHADSHSEKFILPVLSCDKHQSSPLIPLFTHLPRFVPQVRLSSPRFFIVIENDPSTQLADNTLPTCGRVVDITLHQERIMHRAMEQLIRRTYQNNMINSSWFFAHEANVPDKIKTGDSTDLHIRELMFLLESKAWPGPVRSMKLPKIHGTSRSTTLYLNCLPALSLHTPRPPHSSRDQQTIYTQDINFFRAWPDAQWDDWPGD